MRTYFAIFCGYSLLDIRNSISFLQILRGLIDDLRVILVYTGDEENLDHIQKFSDMFDVILINDNSSMEFGAYQAGLSQAQLLSEPGLISGIFFLNDTIWKKDFDRLTIAGYVASSISVPPAEAAMVGKCDSYGAENFKVGNESLREWVSTHFFFVNQAFLHRLNFVIAYNLLPDIENRSLENTMIPLMTSFFDGLDPYLAVKLGPWLFDGKWHNSAKLTDQNYLFFRRKLKSILNEMYISGIARRHDALVCVRRSLATLELFTKLIKL